MSECPVCYEGGATCRFICNHTFCHDCVRKWYENGSNSCPMCRRSMCFRGITKMKRDWDRRRKISMFTNLINEVFDDLCETDDMCFFVQCLQILQERFNYMFSKYTDLDMETFEWVLRMSWFSVDFLMNETNHRFYEHPTFTKYLLVSDTVYGVKNKRSAYNVIPSVIIPSTSKLRMCSRSFSVLCVYVYTDTHERLQCEMKSLSRHVQ